MQTVFRERPVIWEVEITPCKHRNKLRARILLISAFCQCVDADDIPYAYKGIKRNSTLYKFSLKTNRWILSYHFNVAVHKLIIISTLHMSEFLRSRYLPQLKHHNPVSVLSAFIHTSSLRNNKKQLRYTCWTSQVKPT